MLGMTSGMTYIGMVDMDMEQMDAFRSAEMKAELAKDDDSPLQIRVQYMMDYEHLASNIISKNKEMILQSGFSEKRGDMIALVPRAFDAGIKLAYRHGDWERSEPKPVFKSEETIK